ncbi:tumor necrosis factor receptor superfamily member 25 [Empidonax traillii]|uniref:tumor necrosis factor receptor superfamily member 25 n=1 Tax=Empidonax traillii TaxID=164674 RepID=UPI000FFD7FCB|nr:tumor necrosis factor receptor superfamily member 25 [Empidonax traillii]
MVLDLALAPVARSGSGGVWPGAEHGVRAVPHGSMAPGAPWLPAALLSLCPQVILAVLGLAASESQPPGWQNHTILRGQRVLVQPLTRLRRHATRHPCPAGMNWIESTHQCCPQCPAGMYLHKPCTSHNNSVCRPCPTGTFLSQPNTFTKCQACYECDQQAFQSVLSNCSATSNVACGCEPGHFRHCLSTGCREFVCQKCQPCTGRLIQRPCSETKDTVCDSRCKPDFYTEGDECRPCHMSTLDTCSKECQQVCGSSNSSSQDSGLEYILLGLSGPLFLGALAIYHKRKRLRHDALAPGPLPMAQAATSMAGAVPTPRRQFSGRGWDSLCWTQPCSPQGTDRATVTVRQSPKHQALLCEQPNDEGEPSAPPEPRSALLQGSQLYAVIDAVPVRRWKEFMRMLELREAEIELVELEVAHIRDQQYEMLKRWCQQTSATLDRIFAALERMELAGCAEALRQSLPAGP